MKKQPKKVKGWAIVWIDDCFVDNRLDNVFNIFRTRKSAVEHKQVRSFYPTDVKIVPVLITFKS